MTALLPGTASTSLPSTASGRAVGRSGAPRRAGDRDRPGDPARPGGRRGRRAGWAALLVATLAKATLSALAYLIVWSLVPGLIGWESTVVMSGSMAPALNPGDIAVVRPVEPAELEVEQILLVDDPDHAGRLRLHRLVELRDGQLILAGDANAGPDSTPVDPAAVHGVGAIRLPLLGLPSIWWAEGRHAPLAGVLGGLMLLVAATRVLRLPEDDDSTAPSRAVVAGAAALPRGDRQHRAGRGRPRGASTARPTRADPAGPPSTRPGSARGTGRHRHRPQRRLLRLTGQLLLTLTPISLCVLLLLGNDGAWAIYSGASTQNGNTFASNRYYNCVNAALHLPAGQTPLVTAATRYYRLTETAGTTAVNTGSAGAAQNGTYRGTVTLNVAGPCPREALTPAKAVTLNGTSGYISMPVSSAGPNTFTEEVWFKTADANGGVLMSFGTTANGLSTANNFDRHIYMTVAGTLVFGVHNGAVRTIVTPTAYNNNVWHLATGTLSAAGMAFYVDGVLIGTLPAVTTGRVIATGYWRVGYNTLANTPVWTSAPANLYFSGQVASAAVYPVALDATEVAAHYRAGT